MEKLLVLCLLCLPLLHEVSSIAAGQSCDVPAGRRRLLGVGPCDPGLECDTAAGILCKVSPGSSCEGVLAEQCVTDSFCDVTDNKCRVKEGKMCLPETAGHCLEHASCVFEQDNPSSFCQCNKCHPLANEDHTMCSGGVAVTAVPLTLVAAVWVLSLFL